MPNPKDFRNVIESAVELKNQIEEKLGDKKGAALLKTLEWVMTQAYNGMQGDQSVNPPSFYENKIKTVEEKYNTLANPKVTMSAHRASSVFTDKGKGKDEEKMSDENISQNITKPSGGGIQVSTGLSHGFSKR